MASGHFNLIDVEVDLDKSKLNVFTFIDYTFKI